MVGFVSYNVDNDKSFKRNIDKAIKAVGNLRFPLGEVSRDIYKTTRQNFILKGDGQYPPLSAKYAKRKKALKPSAPILVYSGELRDSVTKPRHKDSILSIGNQSLVQGTNVVYANAIQDGSKEESNRNMPARKFLFIDDAQALRIERIIGDYVAARLEVVGNVN